MIKEPDRPTRLHAHARIKKQQEERLMQKNQQGAFVEQILW
jgi:hypothetical protein